MLPIDLLSILPQQEPVFVLASGHRTGSTLLQRLLNSCPRLMVWGEHLAYLSDFSRELEALRDWRRLHGDKYTTFMLEDYNSFVPNIMPEDHELLDAARLYMDG